MVNIAKINYAPGRDKISLDLLQQSTYPFVYIANGKFIPNLYPNKMERNISDIHA